MNIKNKPLLTLVVKRKKTPLNVAHNPDKDDEHEDAEHFEYAKTMLYEEMVNGGAHIQINRFLTLAQITGDKANICAEGMKFLFPWFIVYSYKWSKHHALKFFNEMLGSMYRHKNFKFDARQNIPHFHEIKHRLEEAFDQCDEPLPLRNGSCLSSNSWEKVFIHVVYRYATVKNVALFVRAPYSKRQSYLVAHIAQTEIAILKERTQEDKEFLRNILRNAGLTNTSDNFINSLPLVIESFSLIDLMRLLEKPSQKAKDYRRVLNLTPETVKQCSRLIGKVKEIEFDDKAEYLALIALIFSLMTTNNIQIAATRIDDAAKGNINTMRQKIASGVNSIIDYLEEDAALIQQVRKFSHVSNGSSPNILFSN